MRDRASGMEERQGSCHNPCLNPSVQAMKAQLHDGWGALEMAQLLLSSSTGSTPKSWLVSLPTPEPETPWIWKSSCRTRWLELFGYWLKIKTSCQEWSLSHSLAVAPRGDFGAVLSLISCMCSTHEPVTPAKANPCPWLDVLWSCKTVAFFRKWSLSLRRAEVCSAHFIFSESITEFLGGDQELRGASSWQLLKQLHKWFLRNARLEVISTTLEGWIFSESKRLVIVSQGLKYLFLWFIVF